jgi:hypothetical protein
MNFDPELDRPGGQNFQQPFAAYADKAMPGRADAASLGMDIDIVPMRELIGDDAGRHRVVGHQVLDRLVGEDHSPSESHAAGIALEDMKLVAGVADFHGNGEVEARGPAADDGNLQSGISNWPASMLAATGERCISHESARLRVAHSIRRVALLAARWKRLIFPKRDGRPTIFSTAKVRCDLG